jgi:alkylation response protein AidB-like acyl-CoA dehydrogenase
VRARLTRAYINLEVIRTHAMRTLASVTAGNAPGTESSVAKLLWARWHRDLGELAMQIRGASGLVEAADGLDEWQRLFLFTRADTIYGGSDEIQRNIIAERTLGLPREARP